MQTDLLHLQRYHESGDASAFQSLVRHHASMVFATARRITRDASLAEDVSQETFMELARKGRSITESVGAWLHRVAWRRACDVVRAESTRQRYEAAASLISEGRECTWEELEPVFDEAVDELPSEERSVIIEHYLEGRTQTDIATRLGLSQSSVSRLLEQSIDHLRTRLKNKGLLCGAALASMMVAASAEAAPASLIASLQKIALSSIGSGATTTAGATLLAMLLGLNLQTVIVPALLVTACAVGYDLASKESRIAGWLGSKPQATASLTSPTLCFVELGTRVHIRRHHDKATPAGRGEAHLGKGTEVILCGSGAALDSHLPGDEHREAIRHHASVGLHVVARRV